MLTSSIRVICSIDDCEAYAVTRSWCAKHYQRWRAHGDPLHLVETYTLRLFDDRITSPSVLGRILGVSRQRGDQLLNRGKGRARLAVRRALSSGHIVKPVSCARCDTKTEELEAHHWDYHEKLDVRWLCIPCHNIVHPHGNPYGRNGKPQDA